jgi:hypothetical protein
VDVALGALIQVSWPQDCLKKEHMKIVVHVGSTSVLGFNLKQSSKSCSTHIGFWNGRRIYRTVFTNAE